MDRLRSLSARMVISLLIAGLFPLVGYYCSLRSAVAGTIARVEEEFIRAATHRAGAVIQDESASLLKIARDYSEWDETYLAVSRNDSAWLNTHIHRWLTESLGIDVIIFFDSTGKPISSPGSLDATAEVMSALAGQARSGVRGDSGGAYVFACSPVTRSDRSGSPNGCLLLGTSMDREWLNRIQEIAGCGLAVSWDSVRTTSDDFEDGGDSSVDPVNGRIAFAQPQGSGNVYLEVSHSRGVFAAALSNITLALMRTIWFTVIGAIALAYLLLRLAIGPLRRLEMGISRIREKKAFEKLDESGPQEISSLARSFNEMAASLEEHIANTAALTAMSYTDAVTGARNYRYFHERLASDIKQCQQHLRPLVLGLLDINYFRSYNDAMGHTMGDEALRSVATIVSSAIGEGGTTARCGGDDFAVIMPDTDAGSGRRILREISERIERFPFHGKELLPGGNLTVSTGLAAFPDDSTTKDGLIKAARLDMNLARTTGTGRALRYFNAFASIVRPGSDPMGLVTSAQMLLAIVDSVDQYTYWHTQRVVRYTDWMLSRMDMDLAATEIIRVAAFLHDVGKIEISRDILTKPRTLNPDEWRIVRMHPVWGADMVRPVEKLRPAAPIIESHHEHFDGTGYPKGLSGGAIPLGARIIGIADAFDAMTTDRPYRRALSPESALEEVLRCTGTQFDPELVKLFITFIEDPDMRKQLFDPSEPLQPIFNLT